MSASADTTPRPDSGPGLLGLSTDVVVFTVRAEELSVLLVRRSRPPFEGEWSLPGGVLGDDETPDGGARRVLGEKAGMAGVYLEQLYTFGRPDRDPRGRMVTIGYFALVPCGRDGGPGRPVTDGTGWFDATRLPPLAFDHAEIVRMAHRRLAAKLEYSTIALQLMPERFTLSELQAAYEVILGERLDKRNFRKRVRALDCVEPTGETYRAGSHRPARLYRSKRPGGVQFINGPARGRAGGKGQ